MQAQNMAMLAVLCVSMVMAMIAGFSYVAYNSGGLLLTLSRPFSDWKDVKNFYLGLAGQNLTTPDTSASLMLATAWCNYSSPRPNIVPQNRSEACTCLYNKHQSFLLNLSNTFPQDACSNAADDALNCLRYRGVWDVSQCGPQCRVNPAVLAFTSNLALAIPCLACVLGVFAPGLNRYLVYFITFVPALLGICLLMGMRPIENLIYCLALLGIWAGVVLGLDGELIPDAARLAGKTGRRLNGLGNEQNKQSPLIMIAMWHSIPLITSLALVYLAVAHTIRDLTGVLGYALIGFITGFIAQRLYWTRWNMLISLPEANKSESTTRLANAFVTWIGWCLRVGLVVSWIFIFVLAYTQWFPSSPFNGSYSVLVILVLLVCMAFLESLLYSNIPYNNAEIAFGWVESVQVALVLLANTLFSLVSVVDLGLNGG